MHRHHDAGADIAVQLLGIQIMPSSYVPAGMLTLPVGGFLCLGTLIAIMQWALARSEKKNAEKKETEGK